MAISLTGGSLNYYSQIGLVMLIWVMAKNGILIVEFSNQLGEAGVDIVVAIRSAYCRRLGDCRRFGFRNCFHPVSDADILPLDRCVGRGTGRSSTQAPG